MTDDENKPKGRRFRALNVLTLPQGLAAAPGAMNMRLDPGQVVTLDDEALQRHQRFVSGRVRAGDLEEVEEHIVLESTAPGAVPNPRRATGRVGMTVGKPDDDKESGR